MQIFILLLYSITWNTTIDFKQYQGKAVATEQVEGPELSLAASPILKKF